MDIGDSGVTYLSLPPNFQTEENNALGYTVDRQLKKFMDVSGDIAVWTNPGNVPEKYYDYMAASIRAPYYASQYDASTRLGILEGAFLVYMFAGTRKGVEELVSRVFSGEASFVPWYEYEGLPYHFRISVHSSPVKDTHKKFKEILKRVKAARSVLDVVEYIIGFIIRFPEEMDVTNINLHTQLPFWGCDVLNGTRLLDGSAYVDGKRRYDLVLNIKNGIKVYVKEVMDADRVSIKILSCFNVHESTSSLKAVFKLGCSGFWKFLNNDVHLKMVLPVRTNVVQAMDVPCIANGSIKVHTEEKTDVASAYIAAVNFWEGSAWQVITKVRNRAVVRVHEAIGDVTVTYRRNLHYVDGAELLDGSRLLNAFYVKEDI